MLGPGAGRLQALVHHRDGDVELGHNVGRDAAVLRPADDASDPDVGACARDVAIVADWRWDVRNDDALDTRHAYTALIGIDAQSLSVVAPARYQSFCRSRRLSTNAPNRKETGGLIMFGEPWGYGGYGQFHMVVWIILAIAVVAGVVWRLRS